MANVKTLVLNTLCMITGAGSRNLLSGGAHLLKVNYRVRQQGRGSPKGVGAVGDVREARKLCIKKKN